MSAGNGKKPSTPKDTPDEEHKKFIAEQYQLAKNCIELCLTHYKSKQETIDSLSRWKNIRRDLTELVWGSLEEDNPEFFKAYYVKLKLKDQIKEFNRLLLKQAELMESSASVSPDDGSRASSYSSQQHIPTVITAQSNRSMIRDDMQQVNMFHNCGSSIQSSVQGTVNQYAHNRALDASRSLFLSQNPNMGLAQEMNGNHTQAGYAGCSSFYFSSPVSFVESRSVMGDASLTTFSSISSNEQHPNDILSDWNSCLSEQIQQIRDPEFAAAFAKLLGSYHVPPLLKRDANNVVVPDDNCLYLDFQETSGILDPASETLRYPFFVHKASSSDPSSSDA
ncbi:hypothetical protein BUALT_Bualt02G0014500 [Buddleja alternifolia]|uniref:Uncharacterized protein n=1 Tax=Buddleja alternifolia TaxID=168488 RepID=A0AAV6Y315_9LAMI|nr:hypothetical protein BUALT_Bualt02G0014500 [Buddleja alternifolia]